MVVFVNIQFQTPHQYVFFHHHIKHLLLIWEKERKKEIYLVQDETDDQMILQYPGETYMEMVLQELEPVFFQTLATETEEFPAILGATFMYQKRLIGMYYHQYRPTEEPPYFFEITNEQIQEIPEEDYESIAQTFMQKYPDYIHS